MSPPSLGKTQLQPVSFLVKLSPGGTAKQGNPAVALSVCLSVGQLLSSPLGGPRSPGWKVSSVCLMALHCMSELYSLLLSLDPGRWLANDSPTGLWGAPRHFVS